MLFSTVEANDEGTDKTLIAVKSKYANVKVYEQASTSTPIVAVLQADESIGYLRTTVLNGGGWSIVSVNGRPGYVLTAEIYSDQKLVSKNKRKKNKKVKGEVLTKAKKAN